MFRTFFGFEINYWLKGVMVYIFLFIISLMVMGAASSDEVVIQESFSNINRNAPYVIQSYYAIMAILTCLMTTAFANDAASRDFAHQTSQLIFTKPISKFSFLMGRFWGAVMIALIPMLGVSVGVLIADKMPWVDDPHRYGAVNWGAHLWAIIAFAIPNTIFIAAIIFAIAVWLRSTFASFIGIILLMMFYGISDSLVGNLENETFVQLADPFGYAVFSGQTKYWTIDERNSQYLTLGNTMLLWNRLIWLSAGLTTLGLACWRFSFAERRTFSKQKQPLAALAPLTAAVIPKVSFQTGIGASLAQLWSQFKVDLFATIKSPVFLVVVFAGMADTFFSLRHIAGEGFGLKALPVTYSMIQVIRGSLFVYLMIVIVFYSGVLVWKERESKLDEVMDALPHSTWISYTAKVLAILCIVTTVIFAEMMMAIGVQAIEGYDRYQIGLYVKELFGVTMVQLFCFTVLAFLAHIVSPNKYLGYFVFIIGVIANFFAWGRFDIESNMVQFGMLPSYTYSDMFEFAPYKEGLLWFSGYWLLFCTFLSCGAILLWQRGKDRGFLRRIGIAVERLVGKRMGLVTALIFAAWAGIGGWVYYNTEVTNTYLTSFEQEVRQLEYETDLKEKYSKLVPPRTTSVKYEIDVFPKTRGLSFKGTETLVNKSDQPIEQLMVNLTEGFETELSIDNATVEEEFEKFNVRILKFDPPLAPGESTQMEYTVSYFAKGYENNTSVLEIVQNGTFFNSAIAPQLGYQTNLESTDKEDRKDWDLAPPQAMPKFAPEDLNARSNTYISGSSDWVDIETIISTSDDQVAIAPGSLIKKWQKDGRRYFHYIVDTPSLNFYSFISADYKVQQRQWKGIDIEIYYHHEHEWNVSNMLQSVRKSLEYYTEAFGPYKHKQARIIEFPRTSSFAQAFPGTMPYSEGIGFIASIKEKDDIDMVFYVVAHEMAHQWWAHQVIGANMQGATVLSETLAQYSALMVMEKEFGRDIMRKFLKFEMDNYLSSRGRERLEELPLMKVEAQQGYVHYRKGSVVMYYLKEMIGEDKVNAALRSLVDKFAYQSAPYPTSQDLVDALREQTPAELEYLLDDLFKEITLFENRTLETSYKKLADDKYEVTVEIECRKFQASSEGKQEEVKLSDWIEIGAFAKPEEDSDYGKTLYRERKKIDSATNTYTFVVDEVPALAGVDPFLLLIDRLPEDNMKKPALKD